MATSIIRTATLRPCSRIASFKPSQRVLNAPALRLVTRAAAAETEAKTVTTPIEAEKAGADDDYAPSTQQVQGLLTILCEQTDIAELHLQAGGFELKVRRSTHGKSALPAYAGAAAPAAALAAVPEPAPVPPVAMEETVDESLLYVTSPKVGIFRRGRYAGGKKVGKSNMVEQLDKVKRGQTLGFVEQLGTFVAVESPQAGEIVQFLVADGAAVEYGQTVIELAPFFGGHIIGDKKYA